MDQGHCSYPQLKICKGLFNIFILALRFLHIDQADQDGEVVFNPVMNLPQEIFLLLGSFNNSHFSFFKFLNISCNRNKFHEVPGL